MGSVADAEMNALWNQIEEEIDLGRFVDDRIEDRSDGRNEGNYSDDSADQNEHAKREEGANKEVAKDGEVIHGFNRGEDGDGRVYEGEDVDHDGDVKDSTQNSSGNLQTEEDGVQAHLLDG